MNKRINAFFFQKPFGFFDGVKKFVIKKMGDSEIRITAVPAYDWAGPKSIADKFIQANIELCQLWNELAHPVPVVENSGPQDLDRALNWRWPLD